MAVPKYNRSNRITEDSTIRDEIQNVVPATNQNEVPDFETSVPEEKKNKIRLNFLRYL